MFADFLLAKMQEYEREQGRRVTVREFADRLKVKRPALSQWMLGDTEPSLESVRQLAEVFGPEVYKVLDVSPPDPLLEYILRNWDKLPPDAQRKINEQVEAYMARQEARRKLGPSEVSP